MLIHANANAIVINGINTTDGVKAQLVPASVICAVINVVQAIVGNKAPNLRIEIAEIVALLIVLKVLSYFTSARFNPAATLPAMVLTIVHPTAQCIGHIIQEIDQNAAALTAAVADIVTNEAFEILNVLT